jgi:8-oxo-dGDP phosphatase
MTESAGIVVAWRRHGGTVVHRTPWFEVCTDSIICPDGRREPVAYVVAPATVTVLAVDDDDMVLLTRRWIYGHGGTQWRLPSGPVPAWDTDLVAAARRRLVAETGMTAGSVRRLGAVHGADDVCAQVGHVFVATDLTESATEAPSDGPLRVRRLPFAEAEKLAMSGGLPHAGSAHALLVTALERMGH